MAAAAVSTIRHTFEATALSVESSIWPQTPLLDDNLHPLEPARHCEVIVGEVEVLYGPCTCSRSHPCGKSSLCSGVWASCKQKGHCGHVLVAGCIVKHEQACYKAIHFPFKNVDCLIKCCLVFIGEIYARLPSQSISSNRRIRG